MNVSVLSYSFRGLLGEGKMDLFGYLEACKYRYGLRAADIWNGFGPVETSYQELIMSIGAPNRSPSPPSFKRGALHRPRDAECLEHAIFTPAG